MSKVALLRRESYIVQFLLYCAKTLKFQLHTLLQIAAKSLPHKVINKSCYFKLQTNLSQKFPSIRYIIHSRGCKACSMLANINRDGEPNPLVLTGMENRILSY